MPPENPRPSAGVWLPILMYHQVTPRPEPDFRKYSLTPGALASQMRWLAIAGHTPIGLDQLLAARWGQARLPRRPVVITFDDGYRDLIDHALPILQERRFPAIIYLVAGLMGQRAAWLADRGLDLPLMDWPAARGLAAAGIQCGAHSLSHPHLTALDPAACRAELAVSRQLLEDSLGQAVPHLAYPYGDYNETVRGLAAECNYQTACSVRIGLSGAEDDLLALHRVPISGRESFIDFICRLYTGRPLREALQATYRRRLAALRAGLQHS